MKTLKIDPEKVQTLIENKTAQRRELIEKGAGIFVRNLPLEWSETEIESKFKQIGAIQDIQIKYDNKGNS